jgi:imidazolonepropionase-like amidohydrolase
VSTSEYGGRVAATVDDGVVTLEGEVLRTEDVAAVCRLAWMVPGVVDVVYHLTVGTRRAPEDSSDATAGPTATAGPALDR